MKNSCILLCQLVTKTDTRLNRRPIPCRDLSVAQRTPILMNNLNQNYIKGRVNKVGAFRAEHRGGHHSPPSSSPHFWQAKNLTNQLLIFLPSTHHLFPFSLSQICGTNTGEATQQSINNCSKQFTFAKLSLSRVHVMWRLTGLISFPSHAQFVSFGHNQCGSFHIIALGLFKPSYTITCQAVVFSTCK